MQRTLERHRVAVYHGRATFVDACTLRVDGATELRLLKASVMLIGDAPRDAMWFWREPAEGGDAGVGIRSDRAWS